MIGLPRLSDKTLPLVAAAVATPGYDRASISTGVVHFGPGAFHRAHQADAFDRILEQDPRWGICGVSISSASIADALRPQDGLFTLVTRDQNAGARIIGSVRELLTTADECQIIARIAAPATQMITMTVTEKGYCLDAEGNLDRSHPAIKADLGSNAPPTSLIGWLFAGLAERRRLGGGRITIASCDNLADNGRKLAKAVLDFAQERDPEIAHWIAGEACFPSSMVDSITPATDNTLRARVEQLAAVHDAWPVQREAFTQWVVENDFAGARPPLDRAGVHFTSDVAAFEAAKLRLLNGAHSSLAYLGILLGHRTVADAMRDAPLARFIERMMREDIMPSLKAPPGIWLSDYISAILARFANTEIDHQLAQIAWDGSQKLPYRLLDTICAAIAEGRSIERLSIPIAAWLRVVERAGQGGAALIDPIADRLMQCASNPVSILGMQDVFGTLSGNVEFRVAVDRAYSALGDASGVRVAIGH